MTKMLMIYTTWENVDQAKKAAKQLMDKKLCACVNIYPEMIPMFFWPPKSGKIHTYDTPCIIAMPVKFVGKKYFDWLRGEIK